MRDDHKLREDEGREQYLWDGSGSGDPEAQRLEQALAQFRHADTAPNFLARLPVEPVSAARFAWREIWLPGFAFATTILLVLVASQIMRHSFTVPVGPSWDVTEIEGTPRIGMRSLSASADASKLVVGETLITDGRSSVSLAERGLGQIKIEPNSRVRLVESNDRRKRIQLVVGSIHALIWAPPGEFSVDTPSATAVDLGCAYTLRVTPDGSGTIRTTLGWVGFHSEGRESFIPAGAICNTRRGVGPGTPYFEDASTALQEALITVDFGTNSAERSAAVHELLTVARPRDALTLWHLLSRTSGGDREAVYERLAILAPPPTGVTRTGVLTLNTAMLDGWWNSLGLGDISLWRTFEQQSPPRASASASGYR